MAAMNLDTLKAIGGSEWTAPGKHRLYFKDLAAWRGLEFDAYHSGNIRSAALNGQEISNTQARRLYDRLRGAKVWYDVPTGQFQGNVEPQFGMTQNDLRAIADAITARAAEYEAAQGQAAVAAAESVLAQVQG